MASKNPYPQGIKSIVKSSKNKVPLKGSIFLEWDIIFPKKPTEKDKESTVRLILAEVKDRATEKGIDKKYKFEYQFFKCESSDNHYIIRIYRSVDKTGQSGVTTKKSIDPSAPTSRSAASRDISPAMAPSPAAALAFEGPLRPPGPSPKPPRLMDGVMLENTLNLPEETSDSDPDA